MVVLGDLGTGWLALERLFGARALAVLVPPWNRIAPALVPALPEIGFRGLSTFGPRARPEPVRGLRQVNTHVDLIDWRGGRGFVGAAPALNSLVQALGGGPYNDRRAGRYPQSSSCDGRRGLGFPTVLDGESQDDGGAENSPGA